ncbi:hypothetical protein OF83DRAFT_1167378 [Amylostereum chailletii]|nr:hypothetical protein OF83DRAFT_1167378 [Amylostereum chailletii]
MPMPPTDPILGMLQQPARSVQQYPPQYLQVYKQRLRQFLNGLASIHISRKSPLPPNLTGVPYPPGFDPNHSKWSMLEISPEPGCLRLAGKDVDLFKLWNFVQSNGGGVKVTQDHLWAMALSHFDLPEHFPPFAPNGSTEGASILGSIYMSILLPFEEMFRNKHNQPRPQIPAQGQSQPGPSTLQGQVQGGDMNLQGTISGGMPHMGGSLPQSSQAMHSGPPISRASSGGLTLGPGGGPISTHSSLGSSSGGPLPADPSDWDNETRKRKMGVEEDAKRTRQKTREPPESGMDRASAPPNGSAPPGTGPASNNGVADTASQPRSPQRRRVEYRPLVREIETAGGRDLHSIAEEYVRSAHRPLRDLSEWGNVDIDALTMSVRSRISTELSYALSTFTLLSIMRGPTGGGFPIGNCEELLEEVMDLVEEAAFEEGADEWDPTGDDDIITHKDVVDAIHEDGSTHFAGLIKRQGMKAPELGHKQRPADIILTVTNIMRNLSIVPDNVEYLAHHDRLLKTSLRLCGLRRTKDGALQAVSPALSLRDVIAVRKDVLYLLISLGPATRLTQSLTHAASPPAARTARRVFELVASILLDPSETHTPIMLMMQGGASAGQYIKPPQLIDAALEVFTRFGQPDVNRKVISEAVSQSWQRQLFSNLVRRLPLADADFQVTIREAWLSYVEKVILGLYTIAFLASPELKTVLKKDRSLGTSRLLLRLVKKFTTGAPADYRTFLGLCARRAIETLKVLDDGADAFDMSQSTGGPALSFGMGYGEQGEDRVEKGMGLLGGFQEDVVWGIMLQKDIDEGTFRELESLARVG